MINNFKGTIDKLPNIMKIQLDLISKLKTVFNMYCFEPIDTPSIEYTKLIDPNNMKDMIYRLSYKDGNTAALRYDLTNSLPRFISNNFNNIKFPFRRYQIGKVWRADTPQFKQGRLREFIQCDTDIVGDDSINSDIEMIILNHKLLSSILEQDFTININSRCIIDILIEEFKIPESYKKEIYIEMDKSDKIGLDKVKNILLKKFNSFQNEITNFINFIYNSSTKSNHDIFNDLDIILKGCSEIKKDIIIKFKNTIYSINEIINNNQVKVKLSLVRGLDYYTGIIFEGVLNNNTCINSISGGGRYDKLIQLNKKSIPAIGNTIGLDRIIYLIDKKKKNIKKVNKIFLTTFDSVNRIHYHRIVYNLRNNNIPIEMYNKSKSIIKQKNYAISKGYNYIIIYGNKELEANSIKLIKLYKDKSSEANKEQTFYIKNDINISKNINDIILKL